MQCGCNQLLRAGSHFERGAPLIGPNAALLRSPVRLLSVGLVTQKPRLSTAAWTPSRLVPEGRFARRASLLWITQV